MLMSQLHKTSTLKE